LLLQQSVLPCHKYKETIYQKPCKNRMQQTLYLCRSLEQINKQFNHRALCPLASGSLLLCLMFSLISGFSDTSMPGWLGDSGSKTCSQGESFVC
jgi:hypothetical protein